MRNYTSPSLFKKIARKIARKNKHKSLLLIGVVSGSVGSIALLADQNAFAQQQIQVATSNIGKSNGAPFTGKDPITFQADNVAYDAKTGEVTWTGDVHIWQNDHVLRADKVTYNRTTNIANADGNVSMVEPDGEILFTQHVQLGENMREGVMDQVYALLADNGKLAANGARRTGGKVHDFSRSVYTACPICEKDPKKAPFWQLRSYQAIRDMEHGRIDFSDTFIDFFGVPVFYMPFFSMVDPSVKRKSGLLIPSINFSGKYMGAYTTIPYYWAMNKWSDLTFIPLFATKTGPQLSAIYRARFNQGMLRVEGGFADDTVSKRKHRAQDGGQNAVTNEGHGAQGYLFLKTEWALNENWRYGANLNLATSANYMRDYRINGYGQETLNSNLYLEGFGEGAYSKIDMQGFQGINHTKIESNGQVANAVNDSELPFVLPRYTYSFLGQPDALGGRFSFNTTDFIIYRPSGTSDQRAQAALNWDRPFDTDWGQKWLVTLHVDSNIYRATDLNEMPRYLKTYGTQTSGQALPSLAVKMNWPFLREFKLGESSGTQVFEPIVQLIAAPYAKGGRNWNMPNEDSFAYEFSDTTLFALNRYQGTDRLDGGPRANVGIHSNWSWNGHQIDFLTGQSYIQHINKDLPQYSGVSRHMSDVVARLRFSPTQFFSTTVRGRIDPYSGDITYGESIFNAGFNHFGITGGYLYQPITPYYAYFRPNPENRDEISKLYEERTSELTLGASTDWDNWHASAFGRRSLSRKENVVIGGSAGYRNDCFSMDVIYLKQYTDINNEGNVDTVLFMLTFKTLGTFGING